MRQGPARSGAGALPPCYSFNHDRAAINDAPALQRAPQVHVKLVHACNFVAGESALTHGWRLTDSGYPGGASGGTGGGQFILTFVADAGSAWG